MAAALGLGIWLTGCSPAFVPVEDPSEPQTEERNSPETEKKMIRGEDLAFQPLSEEERRWIVTELESFDGDHKFSDMDPEKAASCGGEIRDAYDFCWTGDGKWLRVCPGISKRQGGSAERSQHLQH